MEPTYVLETNRMLTASTAHITRDDARKLDDVATRTGTLPVVYNKVHAEAEYGWFIPTFASNFPDPEQFSPAFNKLLAFSQRHRYDWLMLDRDGPVYNRPELEIHEW